ncbi:MAG TPA: hypothetical protein VEA19_03045 [Actinomycetota bacterium]|nr:hypothetical protein [Actinomycetota bacterium]
MGTVIELETWRTKRFTPIERLERAADRLDDLMAARGQRRAPKWLREGIAEVRSALRQRRLGEAAEMAEALVSRARSGGQGRLFG